MKMFGKAPWTGWKQKVPAWAYQSDYRKIQQKIRKADVVSFDIFDTLIRRDVMEPADIFELAGNEFGRLTGKHMGNYRELRCRSELAARKKSKGKEITWEQIFENMEGIPDGELELLKKLELEYELAMSCPDKRNRKLYEFALEQGKRIILTSDMYLDKGMVERILDKNGIRSYEKLYLSSVCGVRKYDGLLYQYLLKDLRVSPRKILHIGDSVRGDMVQAEKNGLHTCLIPRQDGSLKYLKRPRGMGGHGIHRKPSRGMGGHGIHRKPLRDMGGHGVHRKPPQDMGGNRLAYSVLQAVMDNHRPDGTCGKDMAASIGYEVLGPMLLGYCKWLKKKVEEDKIERIFFLSREGKILREAFHLLYPQSEIPTSYLYVSRQALCVPLLAGAAGFDEMVDMVKTCFKRPVLGMFCTVCGLERGKFNAGLQGIGLDGDTKMHEIPEGKKELVYRLIKKLGQPYFERQKQYVIEYLRQNNCAGNVAVADIGWVGTMQSAIQKYITESGTVLHGYYLGVRNMEADSYYADMHRSGYLFEPGIREPFDLMARFTAEVMEFMFSNRAGSVQRYGSKEGEIIPIFHEAEYAGKEGCFIERVQSGALRLLDAARENKVLRDEVDITPEIAMDAYSHFAVYPSLSTINMFEGYKSFNGYVSKMLPEHGIFYYIGHPHLLMQDIAEHNKIFFLKKLFKVKFPYYRLLKFLIVRCGIKSEYRAQYFKAKG